jgi:hypothetical protein
MEMLLGHLQQVGPSGPGAFDSIRANKQTGHARSSGTTRPPGPIDTPNLGNRCVGAYSTCVLPCPPAWTEGPHGSGPTTFLLPSMEVG